MRHFLLKQKSVGAFAVCKSLVAIHMHLISLQTLNDGQIIDAHERDSV